MYLEELIENVELESDKFECKSRLNREDVVGWLKSIAGSDLYGGDREQWNAESGVYQCFRWRFLYRC